MQLAGDRNRAVFAKVVLSFSDIAGDLINVFVLDGGLWGIGIATAISYWFAEGVLILHFVKPNASFTFMPEAVRVKNLREMFLSGTPMILGRGSSVLTVTYANIVVDGERRGIGGKTSLVRLMKIALRY